MAVEEHARVARQFNEAYNGRDVDAAVALTTEGVVFVNVATGQTFQGAEGVRQFMQGWASAFPDSRVETTNVIADEHGASMEFIGRGTQTGPLQTPTGELPPTGRRVEVAFIQALQFEQGKISQARLYFDALGMLQQLGVVPAPEPAVD